MSRGRLPAPAGRGPWRRGGGTRPATGAPGVPHVVRVPRFTRVPHVPRGPHLPRGPRLSGVWHEVGSFAASGAAAYAADLGLFVWLRGPGGFGPLTAKALSFVAGCTVAYLGNALVTYRGRTPAVGRARQYGVFFAVNVAGALVQLLCLGFSHYVLGLTAPRDDVVSGLGVGMLLATALRFWGTRTLVFRAAPTRPGAPDAPAGASPVRGAASVHRAEEGNRSPWTG